MENFSPDIVDIERESREKKLGRAGPLGTSVCFSRTVREKEKGEGKEETKKEETAKKDGGRREDRGWGGGASEG